MLDVSQKNLDNSASLLILCAMNDAQLNAMPVRISVEMGTADLTLEQIKLLGDGSLVMLQQPAGAPVLLRVNGMPYARGEVVVDDDTYGIHVTEIISVEDRIRYQGTYELVPFSMVWKSPQVNVNA